MNTSNDPFLKIIALTCLFLGAFTAYLPNSQAYPEFVSYGYSTCITCHYNGNGGGPLNDYGRALFSTEIAARSFYNKNLTEEEIAAKNTFLGINNLPWWLRPGIKARGLWLQTNPGAAAAVSRFINMQTDVNLAIHFDKKQDHIFVASYGYAPPAIDREGKKTNPNYISREHYYRLKQNKNLFIYFGLTDKVYGIRQIDHTSYARLYTQLGQSDQTHGLIFHWMQPTWNVSTHLFAGNLSQEADVRQRGASISGEYQLSEDQQIGASALYSNNNYLSLTRAGVHTRLALTKGSSILAETGLIQDGILGSRESVLGSYAWLQTTFNIIRGYNIYSTFEHYNKEFKSSAEDKYRWILGGLFFPHPGYEGRISIFNGKSYIPDQGKPDTWSLQAQLHLSW